MEIKIIILKKKRQTWYAIVKTLETGSNEYFIYYFLVYLKIG